MHSLEGKGLDVTKTFKCMKGVNEAQKGSINIKLREQGHDVKLARGKFKICNSRPSG